MQTSLIGHLATDKNGEAIGEIVAAWADGFRMWLMVRSKAGNLSPVLAVNVRDAGPVEVSQ